MSRSNSWRLLATLLNFDPQLLAAGPQPLAGGKTSNKVSNKPRKSQPLAGGGSKKPSNKLRGSKKPSNKLPSKKVLCCSCRAGARSDDSNLDPTGGPRLAFACQRLDLAPALQLQHFLAGQLVAGLLAAP